MNSSYNLWLVLLSLALAVTASFAALSIASRIPHIERKTLWLWMGGGAVSMGLAIWSMHFVGMLAFHIDTPLAYDIPLTGLSIIFAISATAISLFIVRSGNRNQLSLLISTFFMGSGIAAMHYTGMEALQMSPAVIYDRFLFVLSLLIAYVASFVALHLFFSEADDPVTAYYLYSHKRLAAALLMGIAIAGMHYTAMEAAIFSPDAICGAVGNGIDSGIMSILIVLGVILIISLMLLLLMLDSKYADNRRLRQSEQRVLQVLNSAPQGMLVTDSAGIIRQVNNTMMNMFGYSAEELIDQSVEILLPDRFRKRHAEYREGYSKKPASRPMGNNMQLQARRKDGHEFSVDIGLTPMSFGEPALVLATVVDITDRLELERQLSEKQTDLENANHRIMLATDSAQIGIYEYCLDDNSLVWDEWMHRLYGVTPESFGRTYEAWEKLVYPEDLEMTRSAVQDAIANRKALNINFRILRPDGEIRWIRANGSITFDETGKPVRLVGINQDITDKQEKEEIIWQQANFDALTMLPNRKLFHELLGQEIKQAHRDKDQLWILFLDLDSFKEINDTLGHHVGDELLVLVAKRIQSVIRESDIVARLGGDEFVIILSRITDVGYVDRIASNLIDAIGQSYHLVDNSVHISTSIGIANYPNDANNANDLLKFADQSMYVAKKDGKNRYSYFTPALQEESLQRIDISNNLRLAIIRDEFDLYYQPIFNLETGNIQKAEALIRWLHPDKDLISPADFIPVAEESGIIGEIGSWVFDTAFLQLQSWQSLLNKDFQLSINMSPFQLKVSAQKYDNWLERLANYGIGGENIVIEITEGLLLKSEELVTQRLLEYRDAGVQVAIDDFGTGYSSLAYLKEFDIDYLKIDQSFIRNLKPGSSEHSLSEAMVVMAHKLDLKVIAEGVETEQQLKLLKEMGCDYAQGYLFSRPLPAGEFEKNFILPASNEAEI